jgi:hemerythrin superfamily protein
MVDVMSLPAQLKRELPTMLNEHKLIAVALSEMMDAARKGDKTEWAEFAYRMMHHARNEEEVLYPAALLVGEFVKLRLTR